MLKPVELGGKVSKSELEEYCTIIKILGESREPTRKFIIQTPYVFVAGLSVVFVSEYADGGNLLTLQ